MVNSVYDCILIASSSSGRNAKRSRYVNNACSGDSATVERFPSATIYCSPRDSLSTRDRSEYGFTKVCV